MTARRSAEEPPSDRRFQLRWGMPGDGAGYVIVDTDLGKVVWKGDSRGEAEHEADRLNKEAS